MPEMSSKSCAGLVSLLHWSVAQRELTSNGARSASVISSQSTAAKDTALAVSMV